MNTHFTTASDNEMYRQDKAYVKGRNKGGTIPRASNHYEGAGNPNSVTGTKLACKRAQIRSCGCETCFLPRAPFNLATTLHMHSKLSPRMPIILPMQKWNIAI